MIYIQEYRLEIAADKKLDETSGWDYSQLNAGNNVRLLSTRVEK